jgi:DNA-binding transcriptional MerR regulator
MTVRLTIGEFSKMTYLSVKALRHYHDVGLLEPAEIDPSSGYRRYGADQVPTAQAIRRFRDLDMPLEQVRLVLQAPTTPAATGPSSTTSRSCSSSSSAPSRPSPRCTPCSPSTVAHPR